MSELATQRAVTRAFIKTRPIAVVITPHEMTRTASGGTSRTPLQPLAQQIVRLVEVDTTGAPTVTESGVARHIDWMVLGEYSALLPVHGTFTHDNDEWRIVHVYPNNDYEVRVGVIQHGG